MKGKRKQHHPHGRGREHPGVGMAFNHSGDTCVVLRWAGGAHRLCLSMILCVSFLELTGLDAIELLAEVNAEDWLVAGSSCASWFARFLNRRSEGPLDWHQFWRSILKLGKQGWGSRVSRTRLAPVVVTGSTSGQTWFDTCRWSALTCRQQGEGQASLRCLRGGGCTLRLDAPRVGRPHGLPGLFWTS